MLTTFFFLSFVANNAREPIHISYIPSHLYHMLFELFKVINQSATVRASINDASEKEVTGFTGGKSMWAKPKSK